MDRARHAEASAPCRLFTCSTALLLYENSPPKRAVFMGDTGVEPVPDPCSDKDLQQTIALNRENQGQITPDLAQLVTSWPTLPEAIKAGIMAMVKASTPRQTPSNDGTTEENPCSQ
jgi:hypothetical protein